MCFEILAQRFTCGHLIEEATGKTTPFCLFSEQCQEVKYGHKLFRRVTNKWCPDCTGDTIGLAGKTWPAPRVPFYAHEKKNAVEGAPARLRSILDGGKLSAKESKDLLFYIAGLPDWMIKSRLVRQFGYDVYGLHGEQWEQSITQIAQNKRVDRALKEGMDKKKKEKKA